MKKHITSVSILVCLLFGGVWLNHQYPNNRPVFAMESENEHSEKVLIENTDTLTEEIKNKLKEHNFDIAAIGVSYQGKEIYIRVNGTQQYLKRVEKNIKKLVHGLAQKTIFKDYSVGVEMQIIVPPNAHKLALERNELLSKITMLIQKELKVKGYVEIESILTEEQSKKLIVEVNTSIQRDSLTNINRGKEIEKKIKKSLTEVISTLMAEDQILEVSVYDINQEKIK